MLTIHKRLAVRFAEIRSLLLVLHVLIIIFFALHTNFLSNSSNSFVVHMWWTKYFATLPTMVSSSKELEFCIAIEAMACFVIAYPISLIETIPKYIIWFLFWFSRLLTCRLFFVLINKLQLIASFLKLSDVWFTIHPELYLLLLSIPSRVVGILTRVSCLIASDRRICLHLEHFLLLNWRYFLL